MRRIRLGNAVFEGNNNAYLLDGATTALVDTGVADPAVERTLRAGLADAGLTFGDVEEVLVTHWHHDHSGLAGTVQAESGATVRVHWADAPLVAGDGGAIRDAHERREALFEEWAIPAGRREELRAALDPGEPDADAYPEVTPLSDGDVIPAGDASLETIHLPGHAAGLCGFAFDGEAGAEVFSGDAVLPKYTPNVGGADVRVEDSLATYAASLVRFAERGFARAWPGHRDPIDDPAGRAATILDHHRERTRNVVAVLDEHGPADAWTVSAHLFGDLEGIHVLHGPGEAHAHLEHLAGRGAVARDGREYRLVDPDPDVDALFPTIDAPAGD